MLQPVLFLLAVVITFQSSGVERRQRVFNNTITELISKDHCFWNNQLIHHFDHHLVLNKLGVRKNRIQYKMEMDKFLSQYDIKKIWVNEYDSKYKICIKEENHHNIHIPNKTIEITNLSNIHTFEQYPYLKDHISHIKITQMLSYLPYDLKCVMKMVRYTIYENKIYLETYPSKNFIWNLMDEIMTDLGALPNMDFVVYSRSQIHERFIYEQFDYGFGNSQIIFDGNVELAKKIIIQLPAFMMSKDLNGSLEFNKLLIVDVEIAQFPWKNALSDLQVGQEKYTWTHKINKGFWRGDQTGKPYDYTDFWINIPMYFPRLNLVDISQKNYDYIDAKFTMQQQMPPHKIKAHNISIAIESSPPIYQQLRYKYLINVDGWSANWLTLAWMLRSNSVVLKQQTTKVQWFYDQIKSNVHYVPLKADVSNILQQIQFLQQNDEIALNISLNAQQYAKQNLLPKNIKQNLLKILQQYAQVQQLQLGLYWRISIKYKNYLRLLKIGTIVLLLTIVFWKFIIVYPQVYNYIKGSIVWRGINQYFAQERTGYNQIAQTG